jgi:hypothetical protein
MPRSRAASARRDTGPAGGTPRAEARSPLGSPSCLGDGEREAREVATGSVRDFSEDIAGLAELVVPLC